MLLTCSACPWAFSKKNISTVETVRAASAKMIAPKLTYLPTVTRETFSQQGRITELIENGTLDLDPATDRVMLCGSQFMLKDVSAALDMRGFTVSPQQGAQGDYVIERAFVEQ